MMNLPVIKVKTIGLAVAAALAAVSCSSSGSGPVALDNYCDEYAQMICRSAQRCDCLEGYSVEVCQAYVRPDCVDEVEDPVRSGRYTYNPVEAGKCLGALERIARDCSTEGDDWPDACDRMLVGNVSAGQTCDGDDECVSGLECYEDRCTALPRDNEPCLSGYACAEDHFCGDDDLCHRYRGRGEPCPEGDMACDDDLYCDSRTDTCQPYLASGQSCAHDSYACDDDLYCSESTSTCRPYPGSGQSCADSHGTCADDLYCDASNVCQPQRGDGAACTDDEQCLSWDCVDSTCEAEEDDICDSY